MTESVIDDRPAAPTIDDLERLRAPLTRHCYRMLGAAADTEDAVQETLIRAHERLDRYDPHRAKLATWVHTIATRICLDHLRGARRRALLLGDPASSPRDLGAPLSPDHWVEPMPGRALFGVEGQQRDPADSAIERETVRVAFIALLQLLPPRQRAVLVLRDVVGASAAECAATLDTSVAAINSALQRARATLASADGPSMVSEPAGAEEREVLRRYLDAWHAHDIDALTDLLREDALTVMPPFDWSLRGGPVIAALLGDSDACAGDRLVPVDVNGGTGFGQYRPDSAGVLRPFAIVVPEVVGDRVGRITTFLGSGDRFAAFDLPDTVAPLGLE